MTCGLKGLSQLTLNNPQKIWNLSCFLFDIADIVGLTQFDISLTLSYLTFS